MESLTFSLQALLARHEAYMADAERDRLELNTRINQLELDKLDLEAANAAKIDENRSLLDQLEALNSTVSDSDVKLNSLEASLLSSQLAIRRLEAAADRAADAERHIAVLEDEQDKLHAELRLSREDARCHAQRFNEAQRGLLDMQDQLDRMEREAREERERHAEAVERMERQREIDKQLDVAAGRLKGAAASKQLQHDRQNNKIVGHFVRDLLHDNANLQLGMAELRDMLMSSNDEIESLREQLLFHQPLAAHDDAGPAPTLRDELASPADGRRLSQELHIHHHYHAAKKPDAKKPKRRRHGLLPAGLPPSPSLSAPSSPRYPGRWGLAHSPTAPSLRSRADADVGATPTASRSRNSWAGASNAPPPSDFSSAPSSPPSAHRGSLFDTGFAEPDAVHSPTTSFDPMSPTWRASRGKRASSASSRSYQSMPASLLDAMPGTPCGQYHPAGHRAYDEQQHTIREEDEDLEDIPHLEQHALQTPGPAAAEGASPDQASAPSGSALAGDDASPRPRLRRAPSHESIISLAGGLDIHTLRSRPSQMMLRPLGGADAVVTGVTAQPTLLSQKPGKRGDAILRDHFAGFQTPPRCASATPPRSRALSKWAGWRPWGGSATDAASPPARPVDRDGDWEANRLPGINQPGAIPGFQQYWVARKRKGAPAKVTTDAIDHDALADGLQE